MVNYRNVHRWGDLMEGEGYLVRFATQTQVGAFSDDESSPGIKTPPPLPVMRAGNTLQWKVYTLHLDRRRLKSFPFTSGVSQLPSVQSNLFKMVD